MSDSQVTGSASSYARKYALNGLFAIDDTKDDDSKDNSAPKQVKPKKEVDSRTSSQKGDAAIKLVKEFATIEKFEEWYAKEVVKKSLSELDAADEAKVKAACADKRSKHENVTSAT